SGDSMQIYQGMDIGTAKITQDEMQGVIHHMIDIRKPGEDFSVADFKMAVETKIKAIADRGRFPLLRVEPAYTFRLFYMIIRFHLRNVMPISQLNLNKSWRKSVQWRCI